MKSPKLTDYLISTLNNKEFHVYYYKDSTHSAGSPPHYNILIPIQDDSSLLICLITSQLNKKIDYYRNMHNTSQTRQRLLKSLVFVGKKELPFLDKDSIIDCNQAVYLTRDEFKKRILYKEEFKIIDKLIPTEIKKNIIAATKNSPLIPSSIIKLIIG